MKHLRSNAIPGNSLSSVEPEVCWVFVLLNQVIFPLFGCGKLLKATLHETLILQWKQSTDKPRNLPFDKESQSISLKFASI